MRTRGVRPCSHVRPCSRRIPPSPLEAVLNRRIIACSGRRTTAVFARKTSLYLFSAKSTDRSLRLAGRSPRNAARKVRILACSGKRTTDSPRARSGRLHSLVLAAPAQRGPEVVPAKATCGWFWCYLLPPKGSYTPRHSPRFCLFGRAKKRTCEQGRTPLVRMFVPVRMFAVSSGRRPQVGRPDGASTKILRTFASRKKRI